MGRSNGRIDIANAKQVFLFARKPRGANKDRNTRIRPVFSYFLNILNSNIKVPPLQHFLYVQIPS